MERVGEQAIVQAAAGQHHRGAAGESARRLDPVDERGGQRGLEARRAAGGIGLVGEAQQQGVEIELQRRSGGIRRRRVTGTGRRAVVAVAV